MRLSLKHIYPFLLLVFLSWGTSGCIHNDIPFPRIAQDILSIAAEGQTSAADIDDKERTVTLHLGEEVDPRAVKFTDFTITEGGTSSLNLLEGTYNLTSPLTLTLSRFQSYEWTLEALQPIERYCTFAGQIGESTIDVEGHRVVLYLPSNIDRDAVELTSIKLGPQGHTTMEPSLKAGDILDCTKPITVKVSAWGQTQTWEIYVDVTEAIVTTTQADAWVNILWVYGAAPEDAENGFEYRRKGATEWTPVPEQYITRNGGAFHCYIPHVNPLTSYQVRAVSDEHKGNEIEVTTGAAEMLPNASFDSWWLNGKVWCPWAEGGIPWWDTGNTGASTLGQSNVVPSDDTPSGMGKSAKLETRFVGIAGIGKLAAGSLYAGSFKKVDGTNGILDFGRPWTARPTRLRGYYKYNSAPINYASAQFNNLIGKPDTCQIWVALLDLDAPFEIRTNPKNQQLFDKNADFVIAYGSLERGSDTQGWEVFKVDIKYRDTNRVPKYIMVVSAASKYGDYFTGGAGATLYVDDFSLDYDY